GSAVLEERRRYLHAVVLHNADYTYEGPPGNRRPLCCVRRVVCAVQRRSVILDTLPSAGKTAAADRSAGRRSGARCATTLGGNRSFWGGQSCRMDCDARVCLGDPCLPLSFKRALPAYLGK